MTQFPSVEVNRLIHEEMQNFNQPVVVELVDSDDNIQAYRPFSNIQAGEETTRALVEQEILDIYRSPEVQKEESKNN